MSIYHVIIEKFGVMNIEAESAEEAEQIAYQTPIEEWDIGDSSIIRVEEFE